MKHLRILTLLALVAAAAPLQADISIDPDFSAGGASAPLPLPVTYTFMTSWDGIQWTAEQKDSARLAFDYLESFFVTQPALVELPGPDDFTIRWAGPDFFKDQGTWTLNGQPINMNLTGALAVATKKGLVPPVGWDLEKYPMNEVYFNEQYKWHYNPLTDPDEGDPGVDTDGEFDFWSVLLHEGIHMYCVNYHSTDPTAVMYKSLSDGERRWTLTEADRKLLRDAGYSMVPVPPAVFLGALGLGLVGWLKRRHTAVA